MVILLLLKIAALNSIPVLMLTPALIIMPVVSRWTMVYALYAYPYARQQGLGGEIRKTITLWRFVTATIITLLIVVAAAWLGDINYTAGLVLMAGTLGDSRWVGARYTM